MGVRVVFPDMGKDPSVQLIEKTITENGTYDAITDGANGYSKVNVNVEGGGGSSDFSTAEVTIALESSAYSSGIRAFLPIIRINEDPIPSFTQGEALLSEEPNQVVLYKGHCQSVFFTLDSDISERTFTTSGNVQDMGGGIFDITGDCTITIS